MQSRLIYTIPLVLFVVLAGWLAVQLNLFYPRPQIELIDKPLPDFKTTKLDGSGGSLQTSDFKGEVKVLNFFASWCMPCKLEHEEIMRLSRLNIAPVYGIAYKDKGDLAQDWLNELGNPYTQTGLDERGDAGRTFRFYGIPATYIIDATGRIRYHRSGLISPKIMDSQIIPAIKLLKSQSPEN